MGDRETWIRATCAAAFPRDPPPNIVHQSWRTAEIPKVVANFVSGWQKLPNFSHRLWTDDANRQRFAARRLGVSSSGPSRASGTARRSRRHARPQPFVKHKRARSRPYRHLFFCRKYYYILISMHWKALDELYTMHARQNGKRASQKELLQKFIF